MTRLEQIAKDAGVIPEVARRVLDTAIDTLGWDDIKAYDAEIRKGQSIYEDAGGYIIRSMKAMFGFYSDPTIPTYKRGLNAFVRSIYSKPKDAA